MYIIFRLFVFPVLVAGANTDPIFSALKVCTFSTGGIGGTLSFAPIAFASVLHHRHKRLTVIGVNRFFCKVGVDHNRVA